MFAKFVITGYFCLK